MNRVVVLVGLVAALTLGTRSASAQLVGIWVGPQCKLNTKHPLVNSAQVYLKTATQAKKPEERDQNLKDAERVLKQAVNEGQAENPGIWYFFGRYYLLVDDVAGADSAFQKTETLSKGQKEAVDCSDDIATQRDQAWRPIIQGAAQAMQQGDMPAAAVGFRRAHTINPKDPIATYYLANILINEGQLDSAIAYYEKTVPLATGDTAQVETLETSVFNLARLHHQMEHWPQAIEWYTKYRKIKPGDRQALTGLAAAYEGGGDKTKASAVYDTIMSQSDSMSAIDMFATGISLFRAQNLEMAARAFELTLKKNPYFRDALFNLCSTYLSLGSTKDTATSRKVGERMLPAARRLVEVDGQNQNTIKMLALAFQYLNQQDSVFNMLQKAEELPFEVTVVAFQPTAGQTPPTSYSLKGNVRALGTQVESQMQTMRDSIGKDSTRLALIQTNLSTGKDPKTGRALVRGYQESVRKPKARTGKTNHRLQDAPG